MNLTLLQARHHARTFDHYEALDRPEYPIEQSFGSDDPLTQQQLMQEPSRVTPEPDYTVFVAQCNALRVLGRSEASLRRVAETLRQRFGESLVIRPPMVRYTGSAPVLEPYMIVLVSAPLSYLPPVRNDFVARGGRIQRIVERTGFVLEGEAPLAELLGYDEQLRTLFREQWMETHVAVWLSRYVPVADDGPEAA